jgi:hypothetical protein
MSIEPRDGFLYPDRMEYGVDDETFNVILGTEVVTALMMSRSLNVLVDTEVEHRTEMPIDMLDDLTLAGERAKIFSEALTSAMEAIFILEQNNFTVPDDL